MGGWRSSCGEGGVLLRESCVECTLKSDIRPIYLVSLVMVLTCARELAGVNLVSGKVALATRMEG